MVTRKKYKLQQITEMLNGRLIGDPGVRIDEIIIDSRNAMNSPEALFFAIEGKQHNGHHYIPELAENGIFSFVISEKKKDITKKIRANYIVVKDTLEALQQLAAKHREHFNIPVIAITGSNGKTIVKEWLYRCLADNKLIIRSPKSYNSQVGVPLSVWLLQDCADAGIFEAGISRPGEMEKLERIIKPTIGIFANIGSAHQENFKNLEHKIKEKLLLFKNSDVLIYCKDHKLIDNTIRKEFGRNKIKLINWSNRDKATVEFIKITKNLNFSELQFRYDNNISKIIIPFTDNASVENIQHIITLLLYLDYPVEKISAWIKNLTPVEMRLQLAQGINHCTIINDSYNSDINSLKIALDYLNSQKQHKKRTLILSDILQSGEDEKNLYHYVAKLVDQYQLHKFIGIGKRISKYTEYFPDNSYFFDSTDDFLNQTDMHIFRDETILIKGARIFAFENISHKLEKKLHRTVLEIDLNAITHNLNYFRSLLEPSTKIMVMVKALSYGSGTYEIANLLTHQKVDYLSVAYTDEGVELRQAGIKLPIMVLTPEETSFNQIINYWLEPEIYNFSILDKFIAALSEKQVSTYYPIHIKIDSGMHRLGFMPDQTNALIQKLRRIPYIRVASVYSHLAASDDPKEDDFTQFQIKTFREICDKFKEELGIKPLVHILNSAGIERFPGAQFDMVRLGIGLYGISCLKKKKLRTISSLKTRISQIKDIPAGDTIGYNRRAKYDTDIKLGIVPIGYADGLHRKFGNETGMVYVKGKYAPVIGDVCMDMIMINITGIDTREGDEVIIFGKENPVEELAKRIGTIPYEILTSISSRVKRVYIQE